jgi:hypothetical protein
VIQIRNVPTELHRTLKARAALEGKSMSELLLAQIEAWLELRSELDLGERPDAPLRGENIRTSAQPMVRRWPLSVPLNLRIRNIAAQAKPGFGRFSRQCLSKGMSFIRPRGEVLTSRRVTYAQYH